MLFAATTSAQDTKLVEAAKKEGAKAVAYGSLESNTVEPIIEAFHKKTGIAVEYWRASATKVMDRAWVSCARANRSLTLWSTIAALSMLQGGDLREIRIAGGERVSQEMVDPDLGPVYRNTPIGIVYNKAQIKAADAPKSLKTFHPKYRGKLVMPDPTQHTTTLQWLASLYKIMGKESADKFILELGATKPFLVESLAPSAERVSTGETPVGISLIRYVVTYSEKGAPVDYVRPGKMLSTGQYLALSNKAPRPNSGKAFIDFFLGDESMAILAKMGEFVNRKGFYPPLPDADKIQAVEMDDFDAKGFADKTREYQKLFLK